MPLCLSADPNTWARTVGSDGGLPSSSPRTRPTTPRHHTEQISRNQCFCSHPSLHPSEAHKIPVLYVSSTRPMFQNILIPYRVRLMSKQSFRALPPNPGLVICRALFGRKPSAELFSCRNALRCCVRALTVREFRFAVSEVVVVVSIVIYVHCPPC